MSSQALLLDVDRVEGRSFEVSSDRHLLLLCMQNDRRAQEAIFETYKRLVLGICMRYTSSIEEAKDFSQEAFIRIFESLSKKPTVNSLKGWIAAITVRTVIDQLRRRKNIFVNGLELDNSNINQVENAALESLTSDELARLLQAMPDGYRIVFNLFIVEGYSHSEIASMLGMSASSSRSQLTRGKEWLRLKLKTIT